MNFARDRLSVLIGIVSLALLALLYLQTVVHSGPVTEDCSNTKKNKTLSD